MSLQQVKEICNGAMSRRSFLKTTVAGAGAVAVATTLEQPAVAAVANAAVGATAIAFSNHAIQYNPTDCIGCKKCVEACSNQGIGVLVALGDKIGTQNFASCIGCGQCTAVCPEGAIVEQDGLAVVKAAMTSGNTMVWQFAPSVQHMAGELFGLAAGTDVSGKLAAAVHQMGGIAYRTDCGADFTIMEEATELVQRLNSGTTTPLITSCCPGWMAYAKAQHPELLTDGISSCKSPMEMLAAVAEKKHGAGIFQVAVMPCTAKKQEATEAYSNIDAVLTVREFGQLLKDKGMDLAAISPDAYDSVFDENSGAGRIFGATGGVMEAAVRTAYRLMTGKHLAQVNLKALRGNDAVKTAEIPVGSKTIRVAVVNGIANVESVLREKENYDFIEVMACPGGCAGGGGRPQSGGSVVARQNGMYLADARSQVRRSYENRDVQRAYADTTIIGGQPCSERAKALLHRG